jgi:hypothetical protein
MKKYWDNVIEALKCVYRKPWYWIISIIFALIIFSLNPIIQNYRLVLSNPMVLISLIFGLGSSSTTFHLIILTLLSILSGIVLSFSIFLVKRQITSGISAGAGGILVGIIAPACPSCAVGILGVLGIGGFLAFLPFKGLELGIIGIIIIILTIFYLANKIMTTECKLPVRKRTKIEKEEDLDIL